MSEFHQKSLTELPQEGHAGVDYEAACGARAVRIQKGTFRAVGCRGQLTRKGSPALWRPAALGPLIGFH